jgi:hypothetical protein
VAQVVGAAQVEVRKPCRTGAPRFRMHPFAEAMASVLVGPGREWPWTPLAGRGGKFGKYMTAVLVVGCGSVARTGASVPLATPLFSAPRQWWCLGVSCMAA